MSRRAKSTTRKSEKREARITAWRHTKRTAAMLERLARLTERLREEARPKPLLDEIGSLALPTADSVSKETGDT